MAQVRQISFKIGSMRKAVDWIVYPPSRTASQNDPTLFVQSDKRALSINLTTKKGMLSKAQTYPGFHSTMKICGATEVDVPDEIIKLCTDAQPQSGDTMGNGAVTVIIA